MKKIGQVLMMCVLATVFTLIAFSPATAAERKLSPKMDRAPAVQLNPAATNVPVMLMCPSGWHQSKSNSEEFKCSPNKPTPVKCPEGWKYVEALDCKTSTGYGTQTSCNGCEVGCIKIPVVK